MKIRWLILSLTFGMLCATGTAQEKKKESPPDEKAIMEAISKAATPGEGHKKMNHFEGKWDLNVKMFMDPSKPPTESKASAEAKWIFGGRYLEEKVLGEFGGTKFEGRAVSGYDNVAKQYHSSWIDSMGTGTMISTGKVSNDGKTFTYTGESYDPVSGQKVKCRTVITIVDKDTHTHVMFMTMDVGGKQAEIPSMEITYKRKK